MTVHGPGLHDYPFTGEPLQPLPPPEPPGKRWYRRWPVWIGIGVIAVIVTALIAGLAGGGETKHISAAAPPAATQEPNPFAVTSPPRVDIPDPGTSYNIPTPTPTPTPNREYAAKFGVPYDVSGTDPTSDTPIAGTYTISTPVLDYSFFDGLEKPKAGQFVSFNVQLKATTGGFDYNEWQWYVRGADGTHYDPSSYKDPSFDSGTARAGEKVTGYITFDAPRHGTLVYSPNHGEAIGEWPF